MVMFQCENMEAIGSFLSERAAKVFIAGHRGLVCSSRSRPTSSTPPSAAPSERSSSSVPPASTPSSPPQPIPESALLSGPLEPTNERYAVAKIPSIKMCQAYRIQHGLDAMPTNHYGPDDNFHPENSHVLPALIRRFHKAKVSGAKEVVVSGTGSLLREFLHVDDLADAVVFLMDRYSGLEHVNVGSGKEVTIKELAEMVKEVVWFEGELVWDTTKPDGAPRKLMDSSKLAGMGWEAKIPLREGLADTNKWYVDNVMDH